jgi:hypothetical protein
MGRNGVWQREWDGMEWVGAGRDGMRWNMTGLNGMERDGMG